MKRCGRVIKAPHVSSLLVHLRAVPVQKWCELPWQGGRGCAAVGWEMVSGTYVLVARPAGMRASLLSWALR